MPKVTFIIPGEPTVTLENAEGSLMEAAVDNQVPGIYGACGGVCSCATCHVKIAAAWREKVGPANDNEQFILDMYPAADSSSRLSCQIMLDDSMDGLEVQVVPL